MIGHNTFCKAVMIFLWLTRHKKYANIRMYIKDNRGNVVSNKLSAVNFHQRAYNRVSFFFQRPLNIPRHKRLCLSHSREKISLSVIDYHTLQLSQTPCHKCDVLIRCPIRKYSFDARKHTFYFRLKHSTLRRTK